MEREQLPSPNSFAPLFSLQGKISAIQRGALTHKERERERERERIECTYLNKHYR
jgi:hypothetical protein